MTLLPHVQTVMKIAFVMLDDSERPLSNWMHWWPLNDFFQDNLMWWIWNPYMDSALRMGGYLIRASSGVKTNKQSAICGYADETP